MKLLSIQAGLGYPRRFGIFGAALATVLLIGLAAAVRADTIVQGFSAKSSLEPGWIVALAKDSVGTVEPAPSDDPSRIYGVVIDPSKAPVTLQSQRGQKVFVATNGTYPVLISTQNGKINPGDYVSLSSTDGIAAKATSTQSTILGQALEKFDGIHNVITTAANGSTIGRVAVSITPGKNPLTKNDAAIPAPLRRAGQAIAGKSVSAARIYTALAVFLATGVIAISVLWVGIRSGMVAIGRNPLSRHSIMQGLVQVIIVAMIVFGIGAFAVYLLLRL